MATAARSSASLCRRVQQQGWRAKIVEPRPQQATTLAAYRRSSGSSSGSSSNGNRRKGSGNSSYGWYDVPLAPGASILLATALLCSTWAQPPAETGWWPFNRRPKSPFDDTVARTGKRQRARAEREMREYLEKMRVPVQELMAGLRKGEVGLSAAATVLGVGESGRLGRPPVLPAVSGLMRVCLHVPLIPLVVVDRRRESGG